MGMLDKLLGKQVSLAEAVELTSVSIFGNAVAQVRDLIQAKSLPDVLGRDPNNLNQSAWGLVLELVVFSLHWSDRTAFSVLGPARRAKFMDALVGSVASSLSDTILIDKSAEARPRFRTSFLELYSSRQETLAVCPLPAGNDAPLKGTLFWEAGKLAAASLLGEEFTDTTFVFMITFASCAVALRDLRGRLQHLGE